MEVKRKYHIDALRILACFMVIFNHFDLGFFAFNYKQQGSISYWLLLLLSVFCKFAVPIFFMITGALLLKKDEPISTLYKKRVRRIAITLFAASIFYYLFEKYIINSSGVRFSSIYTSEAEYHLWYLYSYIALLISLPFLRSIAKDLTKSKIIYLAIMYVVIRYFIPLIELLLFNNTYRMNPRISGVFACTDIFFLPLAGYYIENRLDKAPGRNQLLAMWGINLLTLIFSMYATSLINGAVKNIWLINQAYISLFSSTNAIVIYLTIKSLSFKKLTEKTKKILLHLSSCTFGIYIIHLAFMRIINTRPEAGCFCELPTVAQIGLWFLISAAVFLASYILVAVVKKLPIIKNYI